MNTPGFTAEASLAGAVDRYRARTTFEATKGAIQPQFTVEGPCEPFRSCCLLTGDRTCCRDYFRCLRGIARFE